MSSDLPQQLLPSLQMTTMEDSDRNLLPPTPDEIRVENQQGGAREEGSPWSQDRIKSIIYSGLDSILASFSLLSSLSSGRHLSSGDALALGLANLVADGINMGFGDFVSSSSEKDKAEKEREDIERGLRMRRRTQLSELVDAYKELGMTDGDATAVVSIFSKYRSIFLDEKMATQKGLLPPRKIEQPWKTALLSFFVVVAFGCAPLLSFIVLIPFTDNYYIKFVSACILSTLALDFLGMARAKITGKRYVYAVVVTLLNGWFAASAYLLSWVLRSVAGEW